MLITQTLAPQISKNVATLNNTNNSRISFKGNIDDSFEYESKDCKEEIKAEVINPHNVRLYGKLNDKDYDITFKTDEDDYSRRKIATIKGTYDGNYVLLGGHYKDKKHHHYQGSFGDKDINIKYRLGGLFIDDKMEGIINGEKFKAKFPSASCKDENTDLMVLLLHLSGNVPIFEGCNFSVVDSSLTRYSYFNGGLDCNKRPIYTLFDDIWEDPISVPCV